MYGDQDLVEDYECKPHVDSIESWCDPVTQSWYACFNFADDSVLARKCWSLRKALETGYAEMQKELPAALARIEAENREQAEYLGHVQAITGDSRVSHASFRESKKGRVQVFLCLGDFEGEHIVQCKGDYCLKMDDAIRDAYKHGKQRIDEMKRTLIALCETL